MRIGIVGAGAAGLCTAWLLEQDHDVTLFEQSQRLGGHAHTVEVEQAGERVGVDAGFEFFSGGRFPTFLRLLNRLGVELNHYPLTATFYTPDNCYTCLLPPLRDGRASWSAVGPRQVHQPVAQQRAQAALLRPAANGSHFFESGPGGAATICKVNL